MLSNIRKEFPIFNQEPNFIYFDNAATTLKPQCVIDKINDYYQSPASVHRGNYPLAEKISSAYEETRDLIQEFINAPNREDIIFTYGTTFGINLVKNSFAQDYLQSGDEILISTLEHHSNLVPWQILAEEKSCKLKVIPINDMGELDLEAYKAMISDKTKFLAINYVSNSLGTINPIKNIIEIAKKYNICVLVDAAQAIAHEKIDVEYLDCDFLVFSGHKLYGPTGIGVLYAKKGLLDEAKPFLSGGDMVKSVSFDKTIYGNCPERYEAGTPNIAGVLGLQEAIKWLNRLSWQNIQDQEKDLLDYMNKKLDQVDIILIGQAKNKIPIFSLNSPNIHFFDLDSILSQEGVALRSGFHCTEPLMKRFGITGTLRASLSLYNTKEEINFFIKKLNKALSLFN